MIDFINAITPVLDVLGSVPVTTDHLHDVGETASHAAELAHTEEVHAEDAHAGHLHADEHLHGAEESGGEGIGAIWNEAWSVISDPAHAIAEVFYNVAVDLVIIPIAVLLYKKIREPKLRAAIHKEIDDEHGITHSDCNGVSKDETSGEKVAAVR